MIAVQSYAIQAWGLFDFVIPYTVKKVLGVRLSELGIPHLMLLVDSNYPTWVPVAEHERPFPVTTIQVYAAEEQLPIPPEYAHFEYAGMTDYAYSYNGVTNHKTLTHYFVHRRESE